MKIIGFLFCIIILILTGCRKKEELTSVQWISVEENIPVFSIHFINDSIGFACGGKRDVEGSIYKTENGGDDWSKIYSTDYNRCLYSITFLNDSIGFAGGDYMHLLKTEDGGDTWNVNWFKGDELAFHEKNRPDIKGFHFVSNSTGYFVGGENYSAGGTYFTFDGGLTWEFDTVHHELNDVSFSSPDNGWVVGFGYAAEITNGTTITEKAMPGDFYTGISYLEDDTYILVSNNGAILKYQNGDWNTIVKKNNMIKQRKAFNDVYFEGNFGYAVGNNGLCLISEDYGNSWKNFTLGKGNNLQMITCTNKFIFIGSSNGKIAKIPL